MVRQHSNVYSLSSLLASIIPNKHGYLKYINNKHLFQKERKYGYKENEKWNEPFIKIINNQCIPYTKECNINDWKWINYLPNIEKKPLHIDFGSGSGRYLLDLEGIDNKWNYIGIEIRETAISSSYSLLSSIYNKRMELGLDGNELMNEKNIHFFLGNTIVCMDSLIENLPCKIKRATIIMPDPHFKKSHKKRRMVNNDFLSKLALILDHDGELFFRTDITDVFNDFKDKIGELHTSYKEYPIDLIKDEIFYKSDAGRASIANNPLLEAYYKKI